VGSDDTPLPASEAAMSGATSPLGVLPTNSLLANNPWTRRSDDGGSRSGFPRGAVPGSVGAGVPQVPLARALALAAAAAAAGGSSSVSGRAPSQHAQHQRSSSQGEVAQLQAAAAEGAAWLAIPQQPALEAQQLLGRAAEDVAAAAAAAADTLLPGTPLPVWWGQQAGLGEQLTQHPTPMPHSSPPQQHTASTSHAAAAATPPHQQGHLEQLSNPLLTTSRPGSSTTSSPVDIPGTGGEGGSSRSGSSSGNGTGGRAAVTEGALAGQPHPGAGAAAGGLRHPVPTQPHQVVLTVDAAPHPAQPQQQQQGVPAALASVLHWLQHGFRGEEVAAPGELASTGPPALLLHTCCMVEPQACACLCQSRLPLHAHLPVSSTSMWPTCVNECCSGGAVTISKK
jgi:hypothetical protein